MDWVCKSWTGSLNRAYLADTLVSNGPIDEIALQGPAMTVADGITRPDGYALSLVRISFTYQNRREDLIYPVIHCDSWFVSSACIPWRT